MNLLIIQSTGFLKYTRENKIDLLKKIKEYFLTVQQEQNYKLSDAERMIFEEREAEYQKNKKLISNEEVFKEIQSIL